MRKFTNGRLHPRRLALIELLSLVLLLVGSCNLGDYHNGFHEPECVIPALQTVAALTPTEDAKIDVMFASPQRFSDVVTLVNRLDRPHRGELRPIELNLRHDDRSFAVLGDFVTLKFDFDAALREAAMLKY